MIVDDSSTVAERSRLDSRTPLRVAVLTPTLSRRGGGLLDAVRRPAIELAGDTAMQLRVFSVADDFTDADRAQWSPLVSESFQSVGPRQFGFNGQVRDALRRFAPDIVHTHGLWHYHSIAARRSGVPHIVSPHGMLDPWAVRNSGWKKRLAGAVFEDGHLREAACIHVLCEAEAESVRAYGIDAPICVIPNGVDVPAMPARSLVDDGRSVSTVLYLGRLHPKKGLVELLHGWKVFAERPSTTEAWELCIAGWDDGGHEATLRALTRELSIDDSVRFTGPLYGAEKERCFSSAAAFILPSLSEGLPMTVLEAWAHGLPVLMTAECHLPAGFAEGAALEIRATPESIAQGLKALRAMALDARNAMGSRGRRLAQTRFTWTSVADRLKSLYRWVARRGPIPDDLWTPADQPARTFADALEHG